MNDDGKIHSLNLVPTEPLIIHGAAVSLGFAQEVINLQHSLSGPIDALSQSGEHNVDNEISRLDLATVHISDELLILVTVVEKEIDVHLAEVFSAQKMILNHQVLRDELRKEIIDNLVTASGAVKSVFLRWESVFIDGVSDSQGINWLR